MHRITEMPAWERLFKRIVWAQIGDLKGLSILDFGSGEGITADHYAENNSVTAVEPSEEMLSTAWKDHEYKQIIGDVSALSEFADHTFDFIICHNVLEYIDDKQRTVNELARVLKQDGRLSIVKHNRAGRVMQMAVLHHSSRFLSYRATPPLTISFSAASEYHTVSSGTSLLKGVAAERMPSAIL